MLNIFFIIYSNIDQAELKMTDKKHLDFIKNNYNTMEQEIVNQLTYKCGYPTTQGSNIGK